MSLRFKLSTILSLNFEKTPQKTILRPIAIIFDKHIILSSVSFLSMKFSFLLSPTKVRAGRNLRGIVVVV